MSPFDHEPRPVWQHFEQICAIPRPSRHEGALRDAIVAWAERKGIDCEVDTTGNLILRKPASRGREGLPGVVLQGHLDMVCQKNAGTGHDFLRDPIRPVLRDGWLIAEETTLGADNGIGVAMALAVLEADGIAHPPLEVLLTIDEETGMTGAHGLAPGLLEGQLLINLDTEDWGEVYLGCAGGVDVHVNHGFEAFEPTAGLQPCRVEISGLQGGHSGVDIHLERGSAIVLLARALEELAKDGFVLAAIDGGTARNAIAREASARGYLPEGSFAAARARIAALGETVLAELEGTGDRPGILLHAASGPTGRILAPADQARLIATLRAAPQGVERMSQSVPGVVESSDNLGVLRLDEGRLEAVFLVRSLRDSACRDLADRIAGLFALIGAEARQSGAYPGWTPDPSSPLLACFHRVFERRFGFRAAEKVIHAGLECGIVLAKYPAMQMISFGPTIRGAHAPGERLEIATVAPAWEMLVDLLQELPG
ncbi:MAG: aminoacyl-histidine dipeptidase [Rhodocyclaceae bacterium]|nr:aminoacyl-histidine dipeptidase [Rhodocyclaceae bacterium]